MTERSAETPSIRVWRPRRTRIVAYTMAGVIVLGMIVLAVVVAPQFTLFDRLLLVVLGLFGGWLLHMFARCRVEADEHGLTVVNAFRTRRLAWAEVVRVTMAEGDPWPTLDLSDGTSLGAMGINGAEKARAARHLAELRALLAEHEPPDR
ncbi:PH domain-containing protein [Thermomonospora catenispora]|uniref:PH domain-containing protein n=1 Tax=Thermomonospora catenispora TaxID=2493090 RepID=UPI001F4FF8B9|nr:PH domain-containing protein [Thermomonospora catenispora]